LTLKQPKNILSQYWGFDSFREKQEEIITSVIEGKDTLALLPTGGGKSLCFQVPALCMEGVCIVVTPLVALMNDQVSNLKKRGVRALAVHSGMSKRQIDYALDNVVYGDYKLLYVSPERLKTHLFKERLKKMNVSFIAVDEAHCISQWGYDFRPSYLEVAELRTLLPDCPVLALTATATVRVVEDIQERLGFREKHVVQKSFYRPNLRYFVKVTEDKIATLYSIVKKQGGSGIVYLRSRKMTVDYANMLKRNGIKAAFYHAGLSHDERAGYWQLSEGLFGGSEVMFTAEPSSVYQLQVSNSNVDKISQVLLRSYGGLFDGYVSIREDLLATRSGLSRKEVVKVLNYLHTLEVIDYKESKAGQFVTLLQPRIDIKYIRLPVEYYQALKKVVEDNARSMIHYAFNEQTCRSRMLLSYFGEKNTTDCGVCDYCLGLEAPEGVSQDEHAKMVEDVKKIILERPEIGLQELIGYGKTEQSKKILRYTTQWMIDNGIVLVDKQHRLSLKEK
jgi:superfamily II DNA helicase RecQ